jgi:hypothetical protein
VSFAQGIEFVDALVEGRGPAGELLVDTAAEPPPDTELVAAIEWPGLSQRVFLRASAHGRSTGGKLVLRIDPDEAFKRDFLVGVACGTARAVHRREHRRYCVRLPLEWRRFGGRAMLHGMAEDLSVGGMLLIAADNDAVVGDEVVMHIRGRGDLVVTGRVQHVHRRRAAGELALGIRFDTRDLGQERTLRHLIDSYRTLGVTAMDYTTSR